MHRFSAYSVRESLVANRPLPLWTLAGRVLTEIMQRSHSTIPVTVIGSAAYDFDEQGRMKEATERTGAMLRQFPVVTLVTGGMPAVGVDTGAAFCGKDTYSAPLYHVLPEHHGMELPEQGRVVLAGRSFGERQFALGMTAKISVLIGGGPGATREANVVLKSGGILLPIGSTGGAASGDAWGLDDPLENQVDLQLARRIAVEDNGMAEEDWAGLTSSHTEVEQAIRSISTMIRQVID
ncbi:MAG TPA: hypothetical protein DDZ51_02570 [Planctomycetaceae bacterium]|nr:hypothetical protein [Planctomycetaceae bacterium]